MNIKYLLAEIWQTYSREYFLIFWNDVKLFINVQLISFGWKNGSTFDLGSTVLLPNGFSKLGQPSLYSRYYKFLDENHATTIRL